MGIMRDNIADELSKIASIEEIIIDTAEEMLGKSNKEVTEAFKKSDCMKKLFDIESEYYKNDINIILAEFIRECMDKRGWKYVN